ncbi:SUMF1/EgtB/PvdO family nonheme iron enzyme [Flammeovirga agarivorans]|uniref:SUMF1/EgtB/PvdO family nonheme iron enzyme n=1 Tax=Flammeovirga agarivorans TaxID=2726742 RepID=A0A7X8XU88_9BACT|nr:SUMF1/EgtB/PvdO family nonheme iron enzyme [Flammeovirga agarivorans]NLR89870.1 SUMF1/EgtB/PvdO family nonheme iron enzyme [Flammeovirga agarivorans]
MINKPLISHLKKVVFISFGCLLLSFGTKANNISISNISITSQDIDEETAVIEFDLSWSNSWKVAFGPSNWDAAWIFAKYRENEGDWKHCTLSYVNGTGIADGHQVPSNANISSALDFTDIDNYSNGVFLYSANELTQSSNNANYSNVGLKWDYGYNGVDINNAIEIKVFAIEMVYVPEGTYVLGANYSGGENFFTSVLSIDGENKSFSLTTKNGLTANVNASFPKGYQAFYCMKYEITQGQYCDFLNTCSSPNNRYKSSFSGDRFRYNLSITGDDYSSSNPHVACNFLSWADIATYLDWAALRPMTEMEYEKACRGFESTSVIGNFPWGTRELKDGTADAEATDYVLTSTDETETVTDATFDATKGNALCSYTYGNLEGPIRVGAFAAQTNNTSKATAGASYFGILELAGNIKERVIDAITAGETFDGTHGDGTIGSGGLYMDLPSWPGSTGDPGIGNRGGSFIQKDTKLLTTDRSDMVVAESRINVHGGRGVRTAP